MNTTRTTMTHRIFSYIGSLLGYVWCLASRSSVSFLSSIYLLPLLILHSQVIPFDADGYCDTLVRLVSSLGALSTCLSTYLFLVRAIGVYHDSRSTRYFLTALWAFTTPFTFTAPFFIKATRVVPTKQCVVAAFDRLGAISTITVTIFDLTIFTFISLRVLAHSVDTKRAKWVIFFTASGIGPVMKAILRTGQLYVLYVIPPLA